MLDIFKFNKTKPGLRECNLELGLILDCSTNVVIIFDQDKKVLDANYQVKERFNIDAKSIIGKSLSHLPFIDYQSERSKRFFELKDIANGTEFSEIDGFDKYKNKMILEGKIKREDGRGVVIIKDLPWTEKTSDDSAGVKFLGEASVKLLDIDSKKDLYQYIADNLAYLVPDSYVFVNEQVSPTLVRNVGSATSSKILGSGFKFVGGDPTGKEYKLTEKAKFTSKQSKLTKIGGLYEMMLGQIPKTAAKLAEKVAGVKSVYSIGLFWKGDLLGTASVVTRNDALNPENEAIIETFVNLASVALQRRNEEDKVWSEKEKIKTILYSIGDGVLVVDNELNILMFNEVAAKITGYGAEEVIGRKVSGTLSFVNEKGESVDHFISDCIKTGKITRMEKDTLVKTKSGSSLPVDDSAAPLKDEDGNVIGCVIVFRDVAEERSIDKAKSEFVSLASHQLRTPLSAINWYLELLKQDENPKLSKDQLEYLHEAEDSSKRMVDLVNSLLNVSRIELGTFIVEPEMVDIREVSKSVIAEMQPMITEKAIDIKEKYDSIKKIPLDTKLTRIIFQNLISNAVKYTPDKGKVSVEISVEKENYKIVIEDSGFGIPKSQQDKIFSKLFRADNVKSKEVEGTGLGLYIVKSVIEHTGGRIWFESEENKGTKFYIEMPLKGMSKKEGTRQLT